MINNASDAVYESVAKAMCMFQLLDSEIDKARYSGWRQLLSTRKSHASVDPYYCYVMLFYFRWQQSGRLKPSSHFIALADDCKNM